MLDEHSTKLFQVKKKYLNDVYFCANILKTLLRPDNFEPNILFESVPECSLLGRIFFCSKQICNSQNLLFY